MDAIRMMLRKLRASEEGATAIEYGLIAALIAVACVTAMSGVGDQNDGLWAQVKQKVDESM